MIWLRATPWPQHVPMEKNLGWGCREAAGVAKAASKFAQSEGGWDVLEGTAVAGRDVCDEVEGGGVTGGRAAELDEREDL